MKLPALLVWLLGSFALAAADIAGPPATYLLLDSRITYHIEGLKLTTGAVEKHPANPLFKEDKPWEVRFDNLYANIVYDEKERVYRCWYSPFIVDPAVAETPLSQRATTKYKAKAREMGICYAESRDGIVWTKPSLGLVEFAGDKANNLVLRGPHGAGVFRDARERDPAKLYKLFSRINDKAKTMGVAFSPDGLKWSELTPCPEINVPGDTHNNAFRQADGRFVGITRMKTDQRLVGLTESQDFIHWSPAREVLRCDAQNQAYAMPVFRYANGYFGLLMVFRTKEDRVHCELAWSPGGVTWDRVDPGTPFIANSTRAGDYDWGCVYAAAQPVITGDEVGIYYGASNGPHTGWRDGFLALATLKRDRFAGYAVTNATQGGELRMRSLHLGSGLLRLNADARGGEIRAELLDSAGKPVRGFTLADSEVITGDQMGAPLRWKGLDSAHLRNHAFELRLVLKGKATVYSLSVAKATLLIEP
jgi:hypothetical protein